jgi:hypothetical protein
MAHGAYTLLLLADLALQALHFALQALYEEGGLVGIDREVFQFRAQLTTLISELCLQLCLHG